MLPTLTLDLLKIAAKGFSQELSAKQIPELYDSTDVKAVGTYVEQLFRRYLQERFQFQDGNSASGIDLPELLVDLKATSVNQPQSSSPFKDASQKIYGLGYHLMIFVYDKQDDPVQHTARLEILHVIFVHQGRTADYQTSVGIANSLDRQGNVDDLVAFFEERHLPLDEVGRQNLAARVMKDRPEIGYLTISNALQWRLQYGRAIEEAGTVEGLEDLGI